MKHQRFLFVIFFYSLVCVFIGAHIRNNEETKEIKNALLIANNNYGGSISHLDKPVSEARELKRALESIGFNVTIVENANRESMEDALFSFREQCEKEGGVALFHYGGHAVQIDGLNYLLPANTQLNSIEQVRFKCVSVENLMDSMQGEANIVILDSCRNNPFKSSIRGGVTTRGLVAIKKQPPNSIIVYSAKADKTAQDGVFTPILTQYITEKNVNIEDVLKKVRREVLKKTHNEQTPGQYSQLTGFIYLAGRGDGGTSRVSVSTLTGFLDVYVYTPCSIFVNDEYIDEVQGFSQKRFELPTGVHRLKAKYKDGKKESIDLVIKKGEEESWNSTYLSKEQTKLCISLSRKYLNGLDGVQKDLQKAFEYAKVLADAENEVGEYIVGYCFEEGLNVQKSEAEAFKWYKKACDKGNVDAMYKIGTFYHYGKNKIKKNYKEAKKWYEKALSSHKNDDSMSEVRKNLYEINALIAEEERKKRERAIPSYASGLWRLEANVGYNFSHFTTKNKEIAFNAHGFTLGLTGARFRFFSGLDLKIKTDYTFGVASIPFEKIIYNDFTLAIFQIGYHYEWFSFHVGLGAVSYLWENTTNAQQSFSTSETHCNMGVKFPIDLELEIYNKYIFYAEYSPRIALLSLSIKNSLPFISHSFNIGLQIKILDEYI